MPKKMQIKNYQTGALEIDAAAGAVVLKDGGVTKLTTTDAGIAVSGEILFQNVYPDENSLPSASENHGMFAHVHGTGHAYFAHAGAWIRLAEYTELSGGGGGSSLQTRSAKAGTTASIADGVTTDVDIVGFKSYALMTITTTDAAWVRVYVNSSARAADNGRAETSDPLPDAGVVAEVITVGAETVLISPGVIGYNLDSVVGTNIPIKVTNKSGSAAAITVTLSVLQLEA